MYVFNKFLLLVRRKCNKTFPKASQRKKFENHWHRQWLHEYIDTATKVVRLAF